MLSIKKFMEQLINAADEIIASEVELTAIDAKFGDADHGITMTKVMNSVKSYIGEPTDEENFKEVLDNASTGVMMINGGSAVPLWSTFFEGMCDAAPETNMISGAELKTIFRNGYEVLFDLSKAKVGDKTMMDSLIPAIEAMEGASDEIRDIFIAGEIGAVKGMEASKDFVAKFGRAKSYKEQTIGTPDAGATSMMYFFRGLKNAI